MKIKNLEQIRKQYAEDYISKNNNRCENCGIRPIATVHELIFGRGYRKQSILEGYLACVCSTCHTRLHTYKEENIKLFEKKFPERTYLKARQEL